MKGLNKQEVSMNNKILKVYPRILYWRIQLTLTALLDGEVVNGTSIINLKVNQAPLNGSCTVDKTYGFALDTYFYINCSNWVDVDGIIVRYEFFGII